MPSRAHITATALITLAVAISALATAARGEWWWTLAATGVATALGRDIHHDLNQRRHHRKNP